MNTLKALQLIQNIPYGRKILRFGVILITVLIAVIASYWGSMKIIALLIAAAVFIPLLFFLIRYPNLGFIFILIGGWFVRYSGPGGLNASIIMVIFMIAGWLMDMLVVKRRFEFIQSRVLRPAIYFMVVSVIAFVAGQIQWFDFANQAPLDAQVGGFAVYFFLIALMIMTANTLHDVRWLKAFLWFFVVLGSVFVAWHVANYPFFDLNNIIARGAYVNGMFWTWLVVFPASQALYNDKLDFKKRLVLWAIVIAVFYVGIVIQSDWKSGWVPPAVAVGVLLAIRFKKLVLFLVPLAAIIAGSIVSGLISTDEYSWGTRVDAWIIVLNVAKTSPLIGLGFANYYWYVQLFPIRGWYVNFNSHSQFVDIIAQTGIVGLFCFMWMMFEIGRLSWKLMQKLPLGFERGFAYGVFAGLFGTLMAGFLGDWVLPFAYNITLDGVRASFLPWVFFGALMALEQKYMNKSSSE